MPLTIPAPATETARRGFAKDANAEANGSRLVGTATALTRTINWSWVPDSKVIYARDAAKSADFLITPDYVTVKVGANTVRWATPTDTTSITSANAKTIVDAVLAAVNTKNTALASYTDPAAFSTQADTAVVTTVNTALT